MRHSPRLTSALCAGAALLATCGLGASAASAGAGNGAGVFNGNSTKITNPFLPITKFHRTVLKGIDGGQRLRIVRTLQHRTKAFRYHHKRVRAAVVKDVVRDRKAHRRIEKTIDYFAQDKAGNVYYFGEDVNEYGRGGHVTHEGQWRLGRDTHTPGILMPAHPKLGDSFKSEAVPGITHETDHVVAVGKNERVAGHRYHHVIKVRENAGPPRRSSSRPTHPAPASSPRPTVAST